MIMTIETFHTARIHNDHINVSSSLHRDHRYVSDGLHYYFVETLHARYDSDHGTVSPVSWAHKTKKNRGLGKQSVHWICLPLPPWSPGPFPTKMILGSSGTFHPNETSHVHTQSSRAGSSVQGEQNHKSLDKFQQSELLCYPCEHHACGQSHAYCCRLDMGCSAGVIDQCRNAVCWAFSKMCGVRVSAEWWKFS